VYVLNYEFPFNISAFVLFHTPIYLTTVFVLDYSGPILFSVIKCGTKTGDAFFYRFSFLDRVDYISCLQ
jgi:hypothetical protein